MRKQATIVGGGPAGLAAAAAAAAAGLETTLLDEGPELGGQYHRQPATAAARTHPSPQATAGAAAIGAAEDGSGRILRRAVAFDAAAGAVQVAHEDAVTVLPSPTLIATGASERVVPVPGWTLPGAVSCGGAQALVKAQGVPVGARVLVAGSGPFLLPVAAELERVGADVVAVVEAGRPGLQLALALARSPRRLREGMEYLASLLGRVRLLSRHAVVEIRGEGAVEEAIVARLDASGRVRDGARRRFACDAVCLSDGFLPATELAELAGAKTRWEPAIRARCVAADPLSGRTGRADLFAAGAAVEPLGGAQLAAASGALAAYAMAEQLGIELPPAAIAGRDRAARTARRHRRFAQALRSTYPARPAWYERTTDETIVCRCEDVRAGEIRDAAREGAGDVNLVKRWTRAGMGLCQGRTCGASLIELVAAASEKPVEEVGQLRPRAPLRPVPVSLLADTPGDGA